ncbi:MAG: GNAT family protein [bacterium]
MQQSPNITLTPIERHNLVTIHQWLKDSDEFYYMTDWFFSKPNLDEIEIWYNSLINNNRTKVFMIYCNHLKTPVGIAEVSRIDWKNRHAYLGILIGNKANRNKGYATKALKIIIKMCFEQINLNKLYATVIESNISSIKLFEKLGFQKEAQLKKHSFIDNTYQDQIIFSLLKEDYEKNKDLYND